MLEDGVEIGAFVEIIRSHIIARILVRHLAHLGDTAIGEDVHVGATVVGVPARKYERRPSHG